MLYSLRRYLAKYIASSGLSRPLSDRRKREQRGMFGTSLLRRPPHTGAVGCQGYARTQPVIRVFQALIPVLLGLAPPAMAQLDSRPNIVVILVDDLRYNAIGATGHPFVSTPNIDLLAAEGMLFHDAFGSTPLCSPGRGNLYTGQYARSHGIRGNSQRESVSDTTLRTWAQALDKTGYHTAHIGKWHMDPTSAPRHGFDRWVVFKGQGDHVDPRLNIDGLRSLESGYTTDILTDYAIDFIQSEHGGQPFAMTVAYKAVHSPFANDGSNVPERFRGLYQIESIPRPPNAQLGYTLEGKPMLQNPPPGFDPLVPGMTNGGEWYIRNLLQMLTHIDENVGRILGALEGAGMLDETLVLFTSDNGHVWGEHGWGGKGLPYDESLRVPLLIRYPPVIDAGSESDILDIAPTLMDLAGIEPPAYVHGRSLLPVMADPLHSHRDAILGEYWQDELFPRFATWKTLRRKDWKYIAYPDLGSAFDELYDLRADPFEMRNLIYYEADDPAVSQVRFALEQQLASLEADLAVPDNEVEIEGDRLDYALTETFVSDHVTGVARVGSDSVDPAGGRNAVFLFKLPALPSGQRVTSAQICGKAAT
jgi:N-acetylglucosamine-6-sulfatase